VSDWRINLIRAYPRLFHVPAGRPAEARGCPDCGEGWRDLLERACKRIETALTDGDTFIVRGVSQRRGTLRFYWSGKLRGFSESRIVNAICLAEARSHCTCEKCGEAGRLYRASEVWTTRCIAHAKGVLIPIMPGFENAHLVPQVLDGRTKVVACRYDRATDAFVEIACNPHKNDESSVPCSTGAEASRAGIAAFGCSGQYQLRWLRQRCTYGSARRHPYDTKAPTRKEH
jgi:hypothetical protein